MHIITTTTIRRGLPNAPDIVIAGASLEVSNKEAQALMDRGVAIPLSNDHVISSASEKRKETVLDDESHIMDELVDAMDDVPPEGMGKDGKPTVKALEGVVGHTVSASARDQAWVAYQDLINDD